VTEGVIGIELVANKESLRDVLTFVQEGCARFGVVGSDCFDVRLAVEEVCTNIIDHGYAGREPGPLELSMSGGSDAVVITVADRGAPFDPDSAQQPDLEASWHERVAGGVGLHLVRKVMDELHYASSPDGTNSLTLVKRKTSQEAH
jgi:serine/threonine-protein kinase RsbW